MELITQNIDILIAISTAAAVIAGVVLWKQNLAQQPAPPILTPNYDNTATTTSAPKARSWWQPAVSTTTPS